MRKTILVIMAKEPVAGRVKTRLGQTIGMGRAASLFSIMTDITLTRAIEAKSRMPELEVVIAVDNATGLSANFPCWSNGIPRIVQSSGGLGDRMLNILRHFANHRVILIGADAPELCANHLVNAVDHLRGADCVLGPAADGGYWLIGLRQSRSARSLFTNVRWSTANAMKDTIASLPKTFRIKTLNTLCDIDEADDLVELYQRGMYRSRSA